MKQEDIQFNSANSNIVVNGRELNPVYRLEWGRPGEKNYKDGGVVYAHKFVSDGEKDRIIAEMTDSQERLYKKHGRINRYVLTKCNPQLLNPLD